MLVSNEPASKKREEAATTPKSTTAKAKSSTKSAGSGSKEAKKLYTDTLKAVEKRYIELDKKVKAMSSNSSAITVTNYATSAAKHANTAKKLDGVGETVLAFNFVMALADASHRRISSWKMSGDGGECCEYFARLDEALLPLIEKRDRPTTRLTELPEVPHRWTSEDADVGDFKTGRPNKQQRGQMDRQYIDCKKERTAPRTSGQTRDVRGLDRDHTVRLGREFEVSRRPRDRRRLPCA